MSKRNAVRATSSGNPRPVRAEFEPPTLKEAVAAFTQALDEGIRTRAKAPARPAPTSVRDLRFVD